MRPPETPASSSPAGPITQSERSNASAKDRIIFDNPLHWLPINIKVSNPLIVSGLWRCTGYRCDVTLRVRIGNSTTPCALQVMNVLPDGTGLLRFFCRLKTGVGPKLFRFQRLSPGAPARTIATRLVHMPQRSRRRPARCQQEIIAAHDNRLASLAVSATGPQVSILMPVFNPPLEFLAKAIDSVRGQTYPHWQLCIADDASTAPDVLPFLRQQAAADPRIVVTVRKKNGHISAASNSALSLATGAWCAFLDQDDTLSPHALSAFVTATRTHPAALLFYTDEDKIDALGRRFGAYHKPAWMPELLFAQNFISHLGFYRTDLLRELGGFRIGHEGCQDWDLVLRYSRNLPATQIVHIPHVLYHWRAIPGSTARSTDAKPYIVAAARRTVESALKERGITARLNPFVPGQFQVEFAASSLPSIAVVELPSRDRLDPAHLQQLTDYPRLEFVALQPGEDRPLPALFSAAVGTAAEILVALPGGVSPSRPNWLRRLIGALSLPGVGATGGRLLDITGHVVDGALVLGHDGRCRPAFGGINVSEKGYNGRAGLMHNPGGLGLHGIAVRRAGLPSAADLAPFLGSRCPRSAGWALCAALRSAGLRMIHDPGVEFRTACPDIVVPRQPQPRDAVSFPPEDDPSLHHRFGGEWPADSIQSPPNHPHVV